MDFEGKDGVLRGYEHEFYLWYDGFAELASGILATGQVDTNFTGWVAFVLVWAKTHHDR